MICLGNKIAPKYCISDSFVDYEGYSVSSKGFLPMVVDIVVIWIKFAHSFSHPNLSPCCCPVIWWYLTLCNPKNCSTPGFPVLHHLPELAQAHVQWVSDAIQPSHSLSSPSPALNFFPVSESFSVSWLFASDGQSIGASASASVLPVSIQGWFPLGLTGLISLQSKGLSRVFSIPTIQKH